MNRIKILIAVITTVFLATCLLYGCGGKKTARTYGSTPHISVYFLGADTSRLSQKEAKKFNEMAIKMANDIVDDIEEWGFKATLLESQVGTFNYAKKGYLLRFSLTPHRLVSSLAKSTIGAVAGPNIVEDHFEFVDLRNKQMTTWGEYTKDFELQMEEILRRKKNDAIFKMDAYIDSH